MEIFDIVSRGGSVECVYCWLVRRLKGQNKKRKHKMNTKIMVATAAACVAGFAMTGHTDVVSQNCVG